MDKITHLDGTIFTKEHFLALFDKVSSEEAVPNNLTLQHFNCKGSDRQRVYLMKQLYSSSVGKMFRHFFPDDETMLKIAHMVEVYDKAIHVLTSCVEDSKDPFKAPLRKFYDKQVEVLDECLNIVQKTKFEDYPEDKNNACTLCTKSFEYPYQLKRHFERVHEGEKTQKCEICEEGFKNEKTLKEHTRIVHLEEAEDQNIFHCLLCTKSYKKEGYLKRHWTIEHKENSQVCTFCDETFKNVKDITEHLNIVHEGSRQILNSEPKLKTLPFQKAIIINIKAAKELRKVLLEKFNISSYRTLYASSDPEEQYFSGLRRRFCDSNIHPSTNNILQRIERDLTERFLDNQDFDIFSIKEDLQNSRDFTLDEDSDEEVDEEDIENVEVPHIDSCNETLDDGLFWISAHIAAKFKNLDPSLIAPTAEKFCPSEESKLIFTTSMKKGEFARPHKDWMKDIGEMNKLFNTIFPSSQKKFCSGMAKKFTETLLRTFSHRNKKVLHTFSQQRIFMRVNTINQERIDSRNQLRGSIKNAQFIHAV